MLTATATIAADRHDAAVLADLHIGRIEPQSGPFAFQRPVKEGAHLLVDLAARPTDLT
jgi:hypothetical protein